MNQTKKSKITSASRVVEGKDDNRAEWGELNIDDRAKWLARRLLTTPGRPAKTKKTAQLSI